MTSQTCDQCLYLQKYTSGMYCSMKNRFLERPDAPICGKWKHKPKRKQPTETSWDWVQIEMDTDMMRRPTNEP